MISVLFGAAAALCWGVQNVLLAGIARNSDPGVASLFYVGYMALLAVPFAAIGWDPDTVSSYQLGYILLAGAVQGLGMLFFTRALSLGPVGLLTGLLSLEGAGAALLSVIAGEAIGGPVVAGLVLASLGGVLLVAASSSDTPANSIALTFFAVGCNALGLFSLGDNEIEPALTMVLFNGSSALLIAGMLKLNGTRLFEGRFMSRRDEGMALVVSALGLAGLFAFTIGSREGSAAVTAVLSAQFAGIAALGGYFRFKEVMARRQIAGFGILVLGVSLIAAFA